MADKLLFVEGKHVKCKDGGSTSILWTAGHVDNGNPVRVEWCENKKDFLVYTDTNRILKVSGGSTSIVKS